MSERILVIQGGFLLAGLYFGLTRGYLGLNNLVSGARAKAKVMIFPSLFALLIVNILLKLYLG